PAHLVAGEARPVDHYRRKARPGQPRRGRRPGRPAADHHNITVIPQRPPGRAGRADRAVAHQLLGRPFGSAGGWTVPPAPEFCLALPAGPAPATLASAFPDATRRNRAEADMFLLSSCLPSEGRI